MTGKQRAFLRRTAGNYRPLFQVGKTGVTHRVIQAADKALEARELIKMRVLPASPLSAKEAAREIARATGSEVVGVIGTKFILFRQKKKDSAFDLVNFRAEGK